MNPVKFQAIKTRLMATEPNIIVFGGDISGGFRRKVKEARVEEGAAALADLSAPLGCFAVLGNHDWHDDARAQARQAGPVRAATLLASAGFIVLENASARPAGCDFSLVGLASQQAIKGKSRLRRTRFGRDDLDQAMTAVGVGEPAILLAHEPDIFPDLKDERLFLTLSGHTHAGQIRPFGRALIVPSRHGTRFAYGLHKIEGRHLVVSAGLGASTLPLRIGAVPEITVITVKSD